MLRIAVLVSGGGTNLQALIRAKNDGKLENGSIELVIASRDGIGAIEKARAAGIAVAVLSPKSFADSKQYDMALLNLLKRERIDLVVLAGFMTILGDSVLEAYQNAIINVHPSLIPSFCGEGFYGIRVHEAAISKGVKLTGATVHFVNKEVDGGPIILQKSVEVLFDDTPQTLQHRVMEQAEWELLPAAVALFCDNRLKVEGSKVRILPKP